MYFAPTTLCLYTYLRKVHERCNDPKTKRYDILLYWSYKFQLIVKVFVTSVVLSFAILLAYPLVWYLISGEAEPTLPIMIPFIDETSTKGYTLLVSIQSFWVVIAAVGFMESDLTYGMLSLYIWPLVDLFCDHLEVMNVALRKNRKLGETKEMREYFVNMLKLHNDIVT